MTIKIIIADDHLVIRRSIIAQLAVYDEFTIISEARDGDEALAMTLKYKPDVLILDLNMPGMKVNNVMRKIIESPVKTRILILSAHSGKGLVLGALESGASGYLLKDEAPFVIATAVRAVAENGSWFSESISKIAANGTGQKVVFYERSLTRREWQILEYLEEGFKRENIAEELNLSIKTVEYHLNSIFKKLDVDSILKAVLWSRENREKLQVGSFFPTSPE